MELALHSKSESNGAVKIVKIVILVALMLASLAGAFWFNYEFTAPQGFIPRSEVAAVGFRVPEGYVKAMDVCTNRGWDDNEMSREGFYKLHHTVFMQRFAKGAVAYVKGCPFPLVYMEARDDQGKGFIARTELKFPDLPFDYDVIGDKLRFGEKGAILAPVHRSANRYWIVGLWIASSLVLCVSGCAAIILRR